MSLTLHLPFVTLGVPVYNGERYLRDALDSLIAQDYSNLEIIIADNASTDGTQAICQEYTECDIRVRYFRHSENIGAKRNFEFLVSEARGDYFAWCAHDDLRHPSFISTCVEALEHRPSAVLCNGSVEFLDERGAIRKDWADLNFDTLGLAKTDRFLKLIDHTHWVEMMGLIRTGALRRALPFESVWGLDVVLSMKLLTIGDFAKVPEVLFSYRVRSAPKSEEITMKEVTGYETILANPWLAMLQSLLLAALDSIPLQHEKESFFYSFLHTIVGALRRGPHPSWLELVATGSRGEISTEAAPFQLAKHLFPCLGLDSTLDCYFNSRVRKILLGCPQNREIMATVPEIVNALRSQYANAQILLLGSPGTIDNIAYLGEKKRFNTPSQWSRRGIGATVNELRREQIDIAINLGLNRKNPALDICVSNCGAIRSVGVKTLHQNTTRVVVGSILKRFRINDINESFSHPVCLSSNSNLIDAIMLALGLSKGSHVNSGKSSALPI